MLKGSCTVVGSSGAAYQGCRCVRGERKETPNSLAFALPVGTMN